MFLHSSLNSTMAKSPHTTNTTNRHHGARREARLARNLTDNANSTRTTLPHAERDGANTTTTRASRSKVPGSTSRSMQRRSGRLPPTYDELFPTPVLSCPAREHPPPPKGMDPIVAAMWHNENLSPLLSLPEHLLLRIISMLSNTGLECIRRVARRFPPLCVREILSPQRGNNPRVSKTGPLNWPTFGISSYLRPQFLELIDRDEYCTRCLAARKSPSWEQRLCRLTEYIHCSACGADHPACLFSATQRIKPARLRYCIGHEGYMRICDHDEGTFRLSRLLAEAPKRAWYKKKRESVTKGRCKDPGHRKPCEKVPGGSFPKSKRDCGSHSGFCNPRSWPVVQEMTQGPHCFAIFWTAHVPFDGQLDSLRPKFEELRESAGKHIVPCQGTTKEPPELRCVDPNDCHCTTYAGADNVRWEWECGPWLPGATQCISDPFRGLNTLLPPQPPGSTMSNIVRALKLKRSPECAVEPKVHRTRNPESPRTYGVGRCAVEVKPCHTGKDCLVVDYLRLLRVQHNGKLTPQWYNTLDPDSYNITDDEDGLGVFWCPTPGCRNYYKGVLNYAGILRRRDFRRECRHYDCQ